MGFRFWWRCLSIWEVNIPRNIGLRMFMKFGRAGMGLGQFSPLRYDLFSLCSTCLIHLISVYVYMIIHILFCFWTVHICGSSGAHFVVAYTRETSWCPSGCPGVCMMLIFALLGSFLDMVATDVLFNALSCWLLFCLSMTYKCNIFGEI